jgi:hypothetical protein
MLNHKDFINKMLLNTIVINKNDNNFILLDISAAKKVFQVIKQCA